MSGMAAPPLDQDTVVARALARSGVYRHLGRAFGYPTPSVLEELVAVGTQLAGMREAPEGVRESLARFAVAAREADPSTLADEYVFLFDRQVRCPPYESAYGEAPQMAGKSAELADVAGFYAAFGLTPATARPDMEDHIAAELEFMSVLALKEAYARAEELPDGLTVTRHAQTAFLAEHLGRWAEAFASRLQATTPVPYYAAAAELLAVWIRTELEALGATPVRLQSVADPGPPGEDAFTCPMAAEPVE
jgi:DMSO reductase family type II enzyme chaperone